MTTLAFNVLLPPLMRIKVQLWLCVLPIGLMFAAFGPLFLMLPVLESLSGIAQGAPLRDQPNGLLWLGAFLAVMASFMIAGYLLGWLANAAICRYMLGWPQEKVRAVFMRSEVPDSWLKANAVKPDGAPPVAVADAQAAWEVHREGGPVRFILTRGLLAWGLPMFLAIYLVPALMKGEAIVQEKLLINAVIWTVAGGGFGALMWIMGQSNYRKAQQGR